MKKLIFRHIVVISLAVSLMASTAYAAMPSKKKQAARPRGQWTEQQAWNWEKKVGVIKGFNAPVAAWPGMTRRDILSKAASLGFNSVRFWAGGSTPEEVTAHIRAVADEAESYGLTVTPVISIQSRYFHREDKEQAMKECEQFIKAMAAPLADDPRIVFWDIWNEPRFRESEPETFTNLEWIEQMVYWYREVGLSQPISSSIIWDTGYDADTETSAWKERSRVESMMDIHNFHDYMAADNDGKDLEVTIARVRSTGNRPLVCTECLTRVNGSGLQRSLTAFAREHVHFYMWGMFVSDANWTVKWTRSSYDPYEPMFHNLLWADGDPYDARELEYVRNFHFLQPGEKDPDPGIAVTDRWSQERAWKWMVTGPVKGLVVNSISPKGISRAYNSVRIRVNYNHWKYDVTSFWKDFDEAVALAAENNQTILPVMVTDDDLVRSDEELLKFVVSVMDHYYDNITVKGWLLYDNPGAKATDKERVNGLIDKLFKVARLQFANQPVFMTPCVRVKDFAPDFDYHKALIHGTTGGWDRLEYPGVSDAEMVYKIWSLSDVTAFSTDQPAPEAGWLLSIAYRFGRPIICSGLYSPDEAQLKATLERFSMSHVFWYSGGAVPAELMKSFKFIPIQTKH